MTSSSDPDPKLIITDPDPANNFGSDRIRIHNTALAHPQPLLPLQQHREAGCTVPQQAEEEEVRLQSPGFCQTAAGRGQDSGTMSLRTQRPMKI